MQYKKKEGKRWWMFFRQNTMTTCLRLLIHIFGIHTLLPFGHTCGPSEYESHGGECCPMCNIGSVVSQDCTGDSSTTCNLCSQGTYMNQPNGHYECLSCKNCDQSQGLYIQSKCTTIRNTICDVLDGYYCIEYHNSECIYTRNHSVCRPGQETKLGTKRSDTVCVDCDNGFYSSLGLNCKKWTDCATRNEIETADGSSIKDVTCAQKTRARYGLIVALGLAAFLTVLTIFHCTRSEVPQLDTGPELQNVLHSPIQETNSTLITSWDKLEEITEGEEITNVT
ncbi:tumor necrosis factor receptor superfamily member 14-like [Myxocyprinus asiaticus]|uniref:tumor necrosis factor receptor superfamily member 14-like n=1 Tax=Myxocyprinus asiaticus TaxID=70543 RepID=UPI002222B818|nr:tumor necrosis factor receptor superfamily member 14-like [Myxocyprinus asiaticus]